MPDQKADGMNIVQAAGNIQYAAINQYYSITIPPSHLLLRLRIAMKAAFLLGTIFLLILPGTPSLQSMGICGAAFLAYGFSLILAHEHDRFTTSD